ncbi:putative eka-like protein [Erysiphe necator]|uniref:Putative eka-like protein n=1 Tax=Uncinula necator TaxID=52586 RepID=A0A0B1PCA3_UNCNE|nr:putative eka-like protein [Erysiphe necator]
MRSNSCSQVSSSLNGTEPTTSPHSPSPSAPPSQPLDTQLPNKPLVGRQILKPTAPSKRPIPDKIPQNSRENTGVENAFLPKELAEIIAARQRRERAWHVRVMICTTVLSNIDSTLANLVEDIEKEEAEAIKVYLRLAISNFVAADSSPSPPRVPTHTRPNKGNGNEKGKEIDKNLAKKIAVATPRVIQAPSRGLNINAELPRIPKLNDNSWATVARKGQKKARIDISTPARVAPASKIALRPTNKNKITSPTKAISDNRLFLRLPQEHEWRKLSPAGIREVIVKKLLISPSLMRKIKTVHSGFALSPSSSEAREQILKAENGLFLMGAKLEPATNWIPILVPTVPAFIQMEQGKVEVNKNMLSDEIERVCSVRPVHAGEREYQVVLRARVAEEKAETTESINIDLTSSQITEINSSTNNIQVTPDEVSTGVASRL